MSRGEKSRSIDACLISAITLSILLDFFYSNESRGEKCLVKFLFSFLSACFLSPSTPCHSPSLSIQGYPYPFYTCLNL